MLVEGGSVRRRSRNEGSSEEEQQELSEQSERTGMEREVKKSSSVSSVKEPQEGSS
jgi:hypothetical protein